MSNRNIIVAAAGQQGEQGDPLLNKVNLLSNFNGSPGGAADGQQNSTFIDSSSNDFTVTPVNNPTQSAITPYQPHYVIWFDGVDDYLGLGNPSILNFSSSDEITIEFWFKHRWTGSVRKYLFGMVFDGNNQIYVRFSNTADRLNFSFSAVETLASGTFGDDKWHHFAMIRQSDNRVRGYVDGVLVRTTNQGVPSSYYTFAIGALETSSFPNGTGFFDGFIGDLRISDVVRYDSDFDPVLNGPMEPDANTLFLLGKNKFVDKSSNALSITVNGAPQFYPYTPYYKLKPQDPEAVIQTGSYDFDGVNQQLSIPDDANLQIANSDFCIEAWIYLRSLPPSNALWSTILAKRGSSGSREWVFCVYNSGGTMQLYLEYSTNGSTVVSTTRFNADIKINEWSHVAVSRVFGSAVRFFVDGKLIGTSTAAVINQNIPNTTQPVTCGGWGATSYYLNGKIADARLTIGEAVYTADFDPPTEPLSATANTRLLLRGNNASIFDERGIYQINAIGTAQIDTSIKKFGDSSVKFDGSGYLEIPRYSSVRFDNLESVNTSGGNDLCIECWFYQTTDGTMQTLFAYSADPNGQAGFKVFLRADRTIHLYMGSIATLGSWWAQSASTATYNTNEWNHLVLLRGVGSTAAGIYLNGTRVISLSINTARLPLNAGYTYIGGEPAPASANPATNNFIGYIDDFRFTYRDPRYDPTSSTLTVPTKEFPDYQEVE